MEPAPQRLDMRAILDEVRAELFSVDRGFFYTARRMLVAPGPTVAAYWRGADPRLMRPLRYFMAIFAAYSLAFYATGAIDLLAADLDRNLATAINQQRAQAKLPPLTEAQVGAMNPLGMSRFSPLALELFNVALMFSAGWAAFARWGVNAAERLSLTLYAYGTFNLVQLPLAVLIFTEWRWLIFSAIWALFVGYMMWTTSGLKTPLGWRSAWRGLAWWLGVQLLTMLLFLVLVLRVGAEFARQEGSAPAPAASVTTVAPTGP